MSRFVHPVLQMSHPDMLLRTRMRSHPNSQPLHPPFRPLKSRLHFKSKMECFLVYKRDFFTRLARESSTHWLRRVFTSLKSNGKEWESMQNSSSEPPQVRRGYKPGQNRCFTVEGDRLWRPTLQNLSGLKVLHSVQCMESTSEKTGELAWLHFRNYEYRLSLSHPFALPPLHGRNITSMRRDIGLARQQFGVFLP